MIRNILILFNIVYSFAIFFEIFAKMSTQSDYVTYLNSVMNSFQFYVTWTILPTCVLGNLISLLVYSRPNLNKKTNTGFLYSWMCILNVITVVYYCFISRSYFIFKYTLNLPCGMDNYIRRTALNSITWIQVVIALDRFISVVYPTKMTLMRLMRQKVSYNLIICNYIRDI